jgi:hypothetical protein
MNNNRTVRKETEEFQEVLLVLCNKFLETRLFTENEKELEEKLNELDRAWKQYVHNWNKNPKRFIELRSNDFLKIVNDKLKQLENETKEKK